jgi:hypothetical protein
VNQFEQLGFSNIGVEPFKVPFWARGIEIAEILSPYPQPLVVTTLGGSPSTGKAGVTGEIAGFADLASLEAAKANTLSGKIIFIDEVMTRTQDGSGYGLAVAKRAKAAYEGYRTGALAVLIRSVGTSSHRFAHTGQMKATDGKRYVNKVPAAAISAPDADQLQRMLAMGETITMKLVLTPEFRQASDSGNVIAEVIGTEKPDEYIVLAAHLDSWDLATGALDDGAGVSIVMAAAKRLQALKPKRTIRVILFGSEEVGLVGAKAYVKRNQALLDQHIMAVESDFGARKIWRFESRVSDASLPNINAIGKQLEKLGIVRGGNAANGGPDLGPMREKGVPVATLRQNGWDYFDLHHTPNDTLDKIELKELQQNVAAYVLFAYLVSESDLSYR